MMLGATGAAVLKAEGEQDEAFLEKVDRLLRRLWREGPSAGLSDRMAFELSVEEAVSNAVRHAVPAAGQKIFLELELRGDHRRLEAWIREHGARPTSLPGRSLAPDHVAESGRGLAMLSQLLTELRWDRAEGANVWSLVRELDNG
jgi:anti-sigma regulatory factor (Ser/Thr protein kinase)